LILYNTITPTQEYRRLCENFIEIWACETAKNKKGRSIGYSSRFC
jgi:hypothetical protein